MKINEQAHFKTRFDSYDASYMELRTGANGDMFDCIWQPDNVNFDGDDWNTANKIIAGIEELRNA